MKKLLSIFLAAVLVLSLCACSKTAEITEESSTTAAETAAVTAAEEPVTEAPSIEKPQRNKFYIPVISRGESSDYWQEVQKGIGDAAEYYGVDYTYDAPETEISSFELSRLLKNKIEEYPDAVIVSPIDYDDIYPELKKFKKLDIPVIGLDSTLETDETGATVAYSGIDNYKAGQETADMLLSNPEILEQLSTGTVADPVHIGVLTQDAVTESVINRVSGFADEAYKICSNYGHTGVEGHDLWVFPCENAEIVIEIIVGESSEDKDLEYGAEVLARLDKMVGIFCTTEPCVNAYLNYASSDAEYAKNLEGMPVYGFDAGTQQKEAIENGIILSSIGVDAYEMGYNAMKLAIKAANNEPVSSDILDYIKYDASNINDENIQKILFK